VSNDSRWLTFAGQSVTRFPTHIAELDVNLEVFFKRLSLKKCTFKGITQSANDIGEDMVEHQS
jgi:hypothetical protein